MARIWITGVAAPTRADPVTGYRIGTFMFSRDNVAIFMAVTFIVVCYLNNVIDTLPSVAAIGVDTFIVPLADDIFMDAFSRKTIAIRVGTNFTIITNDRGKYTSIVFATSIGGTKASIVTINVIAARVCGAVGSDEDIINEQTHAARGAVLERV